MRLRGACQGRRRTHCCFGSQSTSGKLVALLTMAAWLLARSGTAPHRHIKQRLRKGSGANGGSKRKLLSNPTEVGVLFQLENGAATQDSKRGYPTDSVAGHVTVQIPPPLEETPRRCGAVHGCCGFERNWAVRVSDALCSEFTGSL